MAEFNQLYKVLTKRVPDRPVLFEFYLNERLYRRACKEFYDDSSPYAVMGNMVKTFHTFGYDYATVRGSEYWFHTNKAEMFDAKSVSLNEGQVIVDRDTFNSYEWMDADKCDYRALSRIEPFLPKDFKLMVMGPGGVLENVINLVGYDNLCFMLYDDRELVNDIFAKVGAGLVKYYENCAKFKSVGLLMSNDDWGFNSQTMLPPNDLREFVFPWHKKIVEAAHNADKPIALHSCGNYSLILDDMLSLNYDARHSYEDKIIPVEHAYDQFQGRIAVLGGIDLNYLIMTDNKTLQKRCVDMLRKTAEKGGYALGSGNSIPDYVPDEKYFAMIESVKLV